MIGGGFGGCVLVLDNKESNKNYKIELTNSYRKMFNKDLSFYQFSISNGVHEVGI
jgi:galactokinase